jgi:hypothetical protein
VTRVKKLERLADYLELYTNKNSTLYCTVFTYNLRLIPGAYKVYVGMKQAPKGKLEMFTEPEEGQMMLAYLICQERGDV